MKKTSGKLISFTKEEAKYLLGAIRLSNRAELWCKKIEDAQRSKFNAWSMPFGYKLLSLMRKTEEFAGVSFNAIQSYTLRNVDKVIDQEVLRNLKRLVKEEEAKLKPRV